MGDGYVFAKHGVSNSELYLLSDSKPAIQRLNPYSLGIPFYFKSCRQDPSISYEPPGYLLLQWSTEPVLCIFLLTVVCQNQGSFVNS